MSDEAAAMNPLNQPRLKRLGTLLAELQNESPRGEVMVSSTVLDEQLADCIRARLLDHTEVAKLIEGFNAPFGTFATRILGAFALGCISDREKQDLESIRRIRNAFAHELGVSFQDDAIKDRCALLTFAAQDYGDVRVCPRSQFTTAVVALVSNLSNRPFYVSRKRLSHENWAY